MALIDKRTQEELHELLLNLIGKSAYATDPGTNKSDELLAWAKMLAYVDDRVWVAFKQTFPSMADELLDDIEHDMQLPNDAARTVDERRARILGVIRARLGASGANVELALEQVAPSARVETITRRDVTDAGVQDELILAGKVQVTPDEWTDVVSRKGARFISRRLLPAVSVGDHKSKREDQSIFVERDARFGSLHRFFDRDALLPREFGFTHRYRWIDADDSRSDDRENATTAHLRTYGPLSLLSSEDMNRLQRAVLPSACISSEVDEWPSAIGDGAQAQFFVRGMGNGTATQIAEVSTDLSVDHRDRILYIQGVYSTSDIRPGQAADNALHAGTQVLGVGYVDPAGSAGYEIWSGVANLTFDVNASGDLRVTNNTGATIYMMGVVFLGPKRGRAALDQSVRMSANPHMVEFYKYESLVRFSSRFWKTMQQHGQPCVTRSSSLIANEAFNGHGPSMARVAVFTLQRPSSGFKRVILDGSRNWLDRIIHVQSLCIDNANRIDFPGSQGDGDFKKSLQRTYYTRTGLTSGATEAGGALRLHPSTSTAVLYVDQDTGALVVERASTDPEADPICGMLMIWASPQLGAYPAVEDKNARVIDAGFANGEPVSPRVLNLFQEYSVMSQGHASHVDVKEDIPGVSYDNDIISLAGGSSSGVQTFPLGQYGVGLERRPWYQLTRSLEVTEFPQTNGQLMRSFAIRTFGVSLIANGEWKTWIIDDQNDWRDRFIHVSFKTSQSDIRPGAGNDTESGHADATYQHLVGGFYSGPGVTVLTPYLTTAAVPYSDNFSQSSPMASWDRIIHVTAEGKLAVSALKDVDTAVQYMVGFVFASPQMGPRTSTWTSPRVQPESSGPGVMVDDLPMRLDNVELRTWINAESGVMTVGDRVLSVTDQGGGEAHLKHMITSQPQQAPAFLAFAEEGFSETRPGAEMRPKDILAISGIKIGRLASFTAQDTGLQSALSDVLDGEDIATLCVFLVRNGTPASATANGLFGYGRPSAASSWLAFPGADPQTCELFMLNTGAVVAYMACDNNLDEGQATSSTTLVTGTPTMVLAAFRRNQLDQVRVWFNNVDVTSAQIDGPLSGTPFGSSHVYLGEGTGTISGQGVGDASEVTVFDAMIFAGDATAGGAMDVARLYDFFRWKLNQGISAFESFQNARPNRTRWYNVGNTSFFSFTNTRSAFVATLANRAIGASSLAEVSGGANGYAICVPIDNRVYNLNAWLRFRKANIVYRATSNNLDLSGDLYITFIFRAVPGAGNVTDSQSTVLVSTTGPGPEFFISLNRIGGTSNYIPNLFYNGQTMPATFADYPKWYVIDDGKPITIEFHHKASTGASSWYINGELAGSATLTTIPATNNSNVSIGSSSADAQWDFGDFFISKEDATAFTTVRAHIVEAARRYFMPEVR